MGYEKINMAVTISRMSDTLYLLTIDGGSEDERHTFVVDEGAVSDLSLFTGYCAGRVVDGDMPMNGVGKAETFKWDDV